MVLVRFGPRFSKFCWSWSGSVRDFQNLLVLVRPGPIYSQDYVCSGCSWPFTISVNALLSIIAAEFIKSPRQKWQIISFGIPRNFGDPRIGSSSFINLIVFPSENSILKIRHESMILKLTAKVYSPIIFKSMSHEYQRYYFNVMWFIWCPTLKIFDSSDHIVPLHITRKT